MLSRPELVVHFFREIVGVAEVGEEALGQRTSDYQNWVEAYARNHAIPIEWAEKGVRKEDHVLPWLRRMEKRMPTASTSSSRAWSKGRPSASACRSTRAKDPRYRIVAHQRSRFTHYYFCVCDEALGPMAMRVASFFPFQTTYYLNGHSFKRAGIGFRKDRNAFLAVGEPLLAGCDNAFGLRRNDRLRRVVTAPGQPQQSPSPPRLSRPPVPCGYVRVGLALLTPASVCRE